MSGHLDTRIAVFALLAALCCPWRSFAQVISPAPSANFGPYDLSILEGGVGVTRPLPADTVLLGAGAPWSLAGWVRNSHRSSGTVIVCAIGSVASVINGTRLRTKIEVDAERREQRLDLHSERPVDPEALLEKEIER